MKGNTVSGKDYYVLGVFTYSICDISSSVDGNGEQTPQMSSEQQLIYETYTPHPVFVD